MEPLRTFESHIAGRNARVLVFPDRIEWARPGRTMIANVALIILAVYTVGLSLFANGCRPRFKEQGRQMLAMRSVQAVSSHRDGLHTTIAVSSGGNTLSFRVGHAEAPGVEQLLRDLVLGTHPSMR